MYFAHVGLGQSQKRVARAFRRDPAAVRQGCARIEDARECRTFDRALTHLEVAGRAWAQAFLGLDAGGAR